MANPNQTYGLNEQDKQTSTSYSEDLLNLGFVGNNGQPQDSQNAPPPAGTSAQSTSTGQVAPAQGLGIVNPVEASSSSERSASDLNPAALQRSMKEMFEEYARRFLNDTLISMTQPTNRQPTLIQSFNDTVSSRPNETVQNGNDTTQPSSVSHQNQPEAVQPVDETLSLRQEIDRLKLVVASMLPRQPDLMLRDSSTSPPVPQGPVADLRRQPPVASAASGNGSVHPTAQAGRPGPVNGPNPVAGHQQRPLEATVHFPPDMTFSVSPNEPVMADNTYSSSDYDAPNQTIVGSAPFRPQVSSTPFQNNHSAGASVQQYHEEPVRYERRGVLPVDFKFEGKSSIKDFLAVFEDTLRLQRIQMAQWTAQLYGIVTGAARERFRRHCERRSIDIATLSYAEYRSILLSLFDVKLPLATLYTKLQNLRQGSMSTEKYIDEKLKLIHQIEATGATIDENSQVAYITHGCREELQYFLQMSGRVVTLGNVYHVLQEGEAVTARFGYPSARPEEKRSNHSEREVRRSSTTAGTADICKHCKRGVHPPEKCFQLHPELKTRERKKSDPQPKKEEKAGKARSSSRKASKPAKEAAKVEQDDESSEEENSGKERPSSSSASESDGSN
ncbi:hypothetical protein HDE_04578 [Halotydeus destructor]|nr:hypothetical protein HDE_04578 [Halotydeus destructor]